jgi:parallel beta-helix repeat protein
MLEKAGKLLRRVSLSLIVALLFLSSLAFTFNIQLVRSNKASSVIAPASPQTIIVPDNFTTIQAAINNASAGDTILVKPGTYRENVVVNKTLSLVGEDKATTIIDGNKTGSVLRVTADKVNVTGFTIQNSSSTWPHDFGVDLTSRKNCRIENCIVRNCDYLFYLTNALNNTMVDNTISNASSYAMYISYCSRNNIIINNTLIDDYIGIDIEDSSQDNLVAYNRITSIDYEGVYILSSNSNIIVHNRISFSGHGYVVPGVIIPGIHLMYSSNTTVADNTIFNCSGGIMTYSEYSPPFAVNNIIENNTIENNDYGIVFQHEGLTRSTSNQVNENTLKNNGHGIHLIGVNNNTFYHNNFIDNFYAQVTAENSTNTWDNGYPSGGNYWSNYTGVDEESGPGQNLTGSDGIGDTPYTINANNTDRYPLMGPFNSFNAGTWNNRTYFVDIVSNSTVTNFNFSAQGNVTPQLPFIINFTVTSVNGAAGFCRVTIPKELTSVVTASWAIEVNATLVKGCINETNGYTYIYFTYPHGTATVQLVSPKTVPEFQPFMLLFLFMVITLLGTIVLKRKRKAQD